MIIQPSYAEVVLEFPAGGQGLPDMGVRPAVQEEDLAGLQPRQSLVEVVLGRMMHNTLSDLSGTSLSPAKETLRPFLGDRYQRVDCSAGWGIEGVSWWSPWTFCGHISELTRQLQDRV
ncbi:hypothetical protein AVEN_199890-1 [Araneus ventricosus]|uniref:Uncharacterized protein n=1 Tax=Araneus ventricosus TaxID=182803 RepID=A0A4Y2HP50_ARAVE|nr:hypothetical protein AVEN_199890-1 [Araneus ventricosus]